MAQRLSDWGKKRLSEGARVNRWLIKNNLTWDDVEKYLEKNIYQEEIELEKCPDCGHNMNLVAEDDTFCTWVCNKCGKGIPVNRSANEELKAKRIVLNV